MAKPRRRTTKASIAFPCIVDVRSNCMRCASQSLPRLTIGRWWRAIGWRRLALRMNAPFGDHVDVPSHRVRTASKRSLAGRSERWLLLTSIGLALSAPHVRVAFVTMGSAKPRSGCLGSKGCLCGAIRMLAALPAKVDVPSFAVSHAPPSLSPWGPVRRKFVTVAATFQRRQTPPTHAVVLMRQRMGGTGSRLLPKNAKRSRLIAARLTTDPLCRHPGDRSFR